MTTYKFICENDAGMNVNTEVIFSVPEDGTHIGTFHEMCARAAKVFGYGDFSIKSCFVQNEHEPFEEFM